MTTNRIGGVFVMPNVELSRSRWEHHADEAKEQRIPQRDHKEKGRRLSAQAIGSVG
jgi:hypothetical protein